MKTIRQQLEEAIWESSNACNDSTLWFEPIPCSNGPRIVDDLMDQVAALNADHVATQGAQA
jgi:hypothetical protein